jgi:hypothetical protein
MTSYKKFSQSKKEKYNLNGVLDQLSPPHLLLRKVLNNNKEDPRIHLDL